MGISPAFNITMPSMSFAQIGTYLRRPNAYISDLKASNVQQPQGEAVIKHMLTDINQGREFAVKAVELATSIGGEIDVWA